MSTAEGQLNPNHQGILKRYFGFERLRPQQVPVVERVLAGKDSLVLMPTGGGKSLCYQFPALCMQGTAVVISPLIALMKDQVDALKLNGIEAAYLNSSLDPEQEQHTLGLLDKGVLDLIYLAPERLFHSNGAFLQRLKSIAVSLFAVDETHCISQWGHDFRPEYVKLGSLKREFPQVPMIALTATADEQTRGDILHQLQMDKPQVFVNSFDRPNIKYSVLPKRQYLDQLLDFLDAYKSESGIIYCLSRKRTEEVAETLRHSGVDALAYHAGMPSEQRAHHQERFIKDEVKVIVATIAFGMGIDKSNVRFVVHVDLPKNIEGYYQETGRAGRDGLPSEALLFYSAGDYFMLSQFCEIEGNPEQSQILQNKLRRMVDYADGTVCRRKNLLNYFGEANDGNCGNCDNCLTERSRYDATEEAQMLLSTIARLDRPYGLSYCTDLLRGSQAEKIPSNHRELSIYGIGMSKSKESWMRIGKEMIQLGLIEQSLGRFPTLSLNANSWKVLRAQLTVELTAHSKVKESKTKEALDYDRSLFEALRSERLAIARGLNLPAYAVLPDNSLMELSTYLPTSEEDLLHITGFGAVKVKRYGMKFLRVIRENMEANGLSSKMDEKPGRRRSPRKRALQPKKKSLSTTAAGSLASYEQGKSLQEIASERSVSVQTVQRHLAQAIALGAISVNRFVPDEELKTITTAFELFPGHGLKIVYDHLHERYSYDKLRFAQAHLERAKSTEG